MTTTVTTRCRRVPLLGAAVLAIGSIPASVPSVPAPVACDGAATGRL